MITVTVPTRGNGYFGSIEQKAQRTTTLPKTISREYQDEETRMYEMSDGSIFNADRYDQNFKTAPRQAIMPEHYKGTNPNRKLL